MKVNADILRILLFSITGFITISYAQETNTFRQKRNYISPSLGYSNAHLDWSIAADASGEGPNVLSELIWSNQRGADLALDARFFIYKNFFLQVGFSGMQISRGHLRDTDYGGDHRSASTYDLSTNSDKGFVGTFAPSLGYRWQVTRALALSPHVGWRMNWQSLYILSDGTVANEGLYSSYKTNWQGVNGGAEIEYDLNKLLLTANINYSYLDYGAKARWNLRSDFQQPVSFRHSAYGYQWLFNLKAAVPINHHFAIQANGQYQRSNTWLGTDALYYTTGSTSYTLLNGVNFSQYSVHIGIDYRF